MAARYTSPLLHGWPLPNLGREVLWATEKRLRWAIVSWFNPAGLGGRIFTARCGNLVGFLKDQKLEAILFHWNCQIFGDGIPVRTVQQFIGRVFFVAIPWMRWANEMGHHTKKALKYSGVKGAMKTPGIPRWWENIVIPSSRYKDPLAPIVGPAQGDQGRQFHVYSIGYILMLGFFPRSRTVFKYPSWIGIESLFPKFPTWNLWSQNSAFGCSKQAT